MILINQIYNLMKKTVPDTITYDNILTLITSQDYSHHKEEELPGLPEDTKFDEKQRSLSGSLKMEGGGNPRPRGGNLKKTKKIYKKNNKSNKTNKTFSKKNKK